MRTTPLGVSPESYTRAGAGRGGTAWPRASNHPRHWHQKGVPAPGANCAPRSHGTAPGGSRFPAEQSKPSCLKQPALHRAALPAQSPPGARCPTAPMPPQELRGIQVLPQTPMLPGAEGDPLQRRRVSAAEAGAGSRGLKAACQGSAEVSARHVSHTSGGGSHIPGKRRVGQHLASPRSKRWPLPSQRGEIYSSTHVFSLRCRPQSPPGSRQAAPAPSSRQQGRRPRPRRKPQSSSKRAWGSGPQAPSPVLRHHGCLRRPKRFFLTKPALSDQQVRLPPRLLAPSRYVGRLRSNRPRDAAKQPVDQAQTDNPAGQHRPNVTATIT